jgi:hypothetical protein
MSETKITVIYDNPTDPAAFEAAYGAEQLEAARKIPGHIRFEASKVFPKEDGSPTPAYRMIDLYYPRPVRSSKRWAGCPPVVCAC